MEVERWRLGDGKADGGGNGRSSRAADEEGKEEREGERAFERERGVRDGRRFKGGGRERDNQKFKSMVGGIRWNSDVKM